MSDGAGMVESNAGAYEDKLRQEIANYAAVTNVHDLPDIFHYWSNKYLPPKISELGLQLQFADTCAQVAGHIAASVAPRQCVVVSIGAGNCETEVAIARRLLDAGCRTFEIHCLEINPHMLERGREMARQRGTFEVMRFEEADFNRLQPRGFIDLAIANQSLHHCLELEDLFDWIARSLSPAGKFVTSDIIGRNGHMRWPEAEAHVRRLWSLLSDRHRYNHMWKRIDAEFFNHDCSKEGFEGIRAQEILPLLTRWFHFEVFLGFGNLIDIFTDRMWGHNFRPDNQWDCAFIDYVAQLDDELLEHGLLKPTHMIAILSLDRSVPRRFYKAQSPEASVRWPGVAPDPGKPAGPTVGWTLRHSPFFRAAKRGGLLELVPQRLRNAAKRLVD